MAVMFLLFLLQVFCLAPVTGYAPAARESR